MLLGGKKAMNEFLRQALELETTFPATMPQKIQAAGHAGGANRRQPGEETKEDRRAGAPDQFRGSFPCGREVESSDWHGRQDEIPPRYTKACSKFRMATEKQQRLT
jgi:hypothetical protein